MRVQVSGRVALSVVAPAGVGQPLLLLHGFTGSAASWEPHLASLRQVARPIAVDLLGHGRSDAPADPARYSVPRCVEDLLELLDRLGVERADLLGYSLGGRVALHLASAAPGRVRRLVLESASPGLADPAERQARVAADERLAEAIERQGVARFVASWERLPLLALGEQVDPRVRARLREQRLGNRAVGLANSLRGMGAGRPEPLWERLPTLDRPTLLVVGERDTTYRAIAVRVQAALPNAELAVVPGAGHCVHLEQPGAFAEIVRRFLAGQPAGAAAGGALGRRRTGQVGGGDRERAAARRAAGGQAAARTPTSSRWRSRSAGSS